jgi:hypothetical protein
MGSVVIGDQRSSGGLAGGPVVPDAGGGQGEQPLGDAGVEAPGGAAAMAFQVELAFEGVVDRFDPLPDPAGRGVAGCLVAAVRADELHPEAVAGQGFEVPAGQALSPIRMSPGRSAPVRAAWASRSAATSRSPIFGLAGHQATGIPSGVVIRYSFSPQYQRECAAQ